MRILILGAKGMLGQCLVRAFSDCEVVAWDRSDLDITHTMQVREQIMDAHPDIVINATAYNAVDRAEEEPEMANVVNGEAVGAIADAAVRAGATLVHFSTDYIFDGLYNPPPLNLPLLSSQRLSEPWPGGGGETVRGYMEDAVPSPLSAYGRSKLLGEQRVQDIAERYPEWRWYVIRTSRLFGPPGASPSAKKSFVDAIIAKAATTDRIKVVDEEWASPTYAPDLAQATRAMFCATAEQHSHILKNMRMFCGEGSSGSVGVVPGVYHRTNDGACTWYGFARVILDTIGWTGTLVPVPASRFPRAAKRPPYSVLATTKLPPTRGWEDAVKEYLDEAPRTKFSAKGGCASGAQIPKTYQSGSHTVHE